MLASGNGNRYPGGGGAAIPVRRGETVAIAVERPRRLHTVVDRGRRAHTSATIGKKKSGGGTCCHGVIGPIHYGSLHIAYLSRHMDY